MQQPPADQQQQQATSPTGARMYGPLAHVFFAAVLLAASTILIAVSHGDDLEKDLDFVTLYKYEKAVPDRSKALSAITETARQNSWLSDKTDAAHCLDMDYFKFPRISFYPENDPTSPTCQIIFNVVGAGIEGQVKIAGVLADPVTVNSCKPGRYPLRIVGGSGQQSEVPYLTILAQSQAGNPNASFVDINNFNVNSTLMLSTTASIGFNYETYTKGFSACRKSRQDLANAILDSTSCQHAGASPLCKCVTAFTSKLTDWNSKLKASYTDKLMLQDVLVNGVARCIDLKRPHDIRSAVSRPYARSSAILIFALALFFNALILVLDPYVSSSSMPAIYSTIEIVVYWAAVFFGALADGDGGIGEFGILLAITLPAFLVHGGYCILLKVNESYSADRLPVPAPFLHPVTFDLCLCALTLFTLVERGVVQHEYLVVEVLKCHAVAAIYIAVTWYHQSKYSSDGGILAAEAVQQAYMGLVLVALAAACAPMVVPYPAKKCFEFHWLLPGAFAYLALANPAWAHSLQVSTKLNSGVTVYNFNEVAGMLALLFGATLWGYFLQDHIQIYGSAHFPYPSVRDPLATVSMRVI